LAGVLAAVVVGGVACGLFSSDLLSYTFKLPEKSVTVSADDAVPQQWRQPPGAAVPDVPCPAGQGVGVDCCSIATAAGEQCTTYGLQCVDGSCEADPQIVLVNEINLAQEAPELANIASNVPSFTHVTLTRLYLSQYSNGLNYPTPVTEVWLGPEAATSVDDQDASGNPLCVLVGTVPSIPANSSCGAGSCNGLDVQLNPDGAGAFEQYARDFRTTFKVFIRMTLQLKAGDPIPSGTFTATVTGEAKASI
jgi:hypothetical protein